MPFFNTVLDIMIEIFLVNGMILVVRFSECPYVKKVDKWLIFKLTNLVISSINSIIIIRLELDKSTIENKINYFLKSTNKKAE